MPFPPWISISIACFDKFWCLLIMSEALLRALTGNTNRSGAG